MKTITTIYISRELLKEINRKIPRGQRSQFFEDAAKEKLARIKQ